MFRGVTRQFTQVTAPYGGKVLLAFVDESERDSDYYFLGALVVTEAQADALRDTLASLIAKHAETHPILAGVELHGSGMMRAEEEPWRSIPLRLRFRIYERALELIFASGARVYIEGVNIARQQARGYPQLTPARELAFSHLFERINACANTSEPTVKIIADEHHTADVSRSNFTRYRSFGTYGYRSSTLANIDPEISFIESHADLVLQASDLVTYIYNRVWTVQENDMRAHRQKHRMWAIIDEAAKYPRGRARIWP